MEIRQMSQEEKDAQIERIKTIFGDIRSMMQTLETDLSSDSLMTQASALWISAQLCSWYHDFRVELSKIDVAQSTLHELTKGIEEAANHDSNNTNGNTGMH